MQLLNLTAYDPFLAQKKERPEHTVGLLFLKCANGRDWYLSQEEFSKDKWKIQVEANGQISAATKDVSTLFPQNCSVYEVDLVPDNIESGEWFYKNGKIILYTHALPLAEVKQRVKQLIDRAAGQARSRFISAGDGIEEEYRLALDQAKHFLATNPHVIPASVQSHADAYSVTATEAANTIVATANKKNENLENIRAIRMSAKARIDNADDATDIELLLLGSVNLLEEIQPK